MEAEQLNWIRGNRTIEDVLRFFDGGDAGDLYNYSPPDPDAIVQADMTQDIQIESAPYYERLILNYRMRIASSLRPDRGRDRGVKLIELTTTVTFYDNMPGIYFRTTFKNAARDHRLRAHIRTGIRSDGVLVDGPFIVQPRPLQIEGSEIVNVNRPGREGMSQTQPVQSMVAVEGPDEALALLVRGLPEYEAIPEDNQTTLALTLVRSVGWLSRDDLQTRRTTVAPVLRTPAAQCQGDIYGEYALVPHEGNDPAALMRSAQEYNAPLQAYQYSKRPVRPTRSYFSVVSDMAMGDKSDGHGVIVTAFKPVERGVGWIVRMVNPHDHPVEVFLTPFAHPDQVHLVTMAETPVGYLEQDANGRVGISVNPYEVVTVRFIF